MDRFSAAADTDDAEWERVLRVSLTAPFMLTRAVLPHMLAAGRGEIVFTASDAVGNVNVNGVILPVDNGWSAV